MEPSFKRDHTGCGPSARYSSSAIRRLNGHEPGLTFRRRRGREMNKCDDHVQQHPRSPSLSVNAIDHLPLGSSNVLGVTCRRSLSDPLRSFANGCLRTVRKGYRRISVKTEFPNPTRALSSQSSTVYVRFRMNAPSPASTE